MRCAPHAPVIVIVTVLDCPCGPAWGPDCCMSNAVGMTTSLVVRPEIRYAQIET